MGARLRNWEVLVELFDSLAYSADRVKYSLYLSATVLMAARIDENMDSPSNSGSRSRSIGVGKCLQ
jgi:hypothetical protein